MSDHGWNCRAKYGMGPCDCVGFIYDQHVPTPMPTAATEPRSGCAACLQPELWTIHADDCPAAAAPNQCDGCARGLRVVNGNHMAGPLPVMTCTAHLYAPPPADDALLIVALGDYQQADEAGIMVLVSREACDRGRDRIAALLAENARLIASEMRMAMMQSETYTRAEAAEARLRLADELLRALLNWNDEGRTGDYSVARVRAFLAGKP